ncbi:hypothetical protein ACFL2D_01270 [Patescibacteria group bacterium]
MEEFEETLRLPSTHEPSTADQIEDCAKVLLEKGFSATAVQKIIRVSPYLARHSKRVGVRFDSLVQYGFVRDRLVRVCTKSPRILNSSRANILYKLNNFRAFGFTRVQIVEIIRRTPALMTMSTARINAALINLCRHGIAKADVRDMVNLNPGILSNSPEHTNMIYEYFEVKGYTQEQASDAFRRSPAILMSSVDRIDDQLYVFEQLGMDISLYPKALIYAPELLMARARYLKSRMLDLDSSNMFIGNDKFYVKFGLTREQLMEKHGGELQ